MRELAGLKAKLIQCLSSVRRDWQSYEQLAMRQELTMSRTAIEQEAQRLHDLLADIETVVEGTK